MRSGRRRRSRAGRAGGFDFKREAARDALVVHRRRRARHVVDAVALDPVRLGHVVADQLEVGLLEQLGDRAALRREEVVHADDLVALAQQPLAHVRAEEAGAARDEHAVHHARRRLVERQALRRAIRLLLRGALLRGRPARDPCVLYISRERPTQVGPVRGVDGSASGGPRGHLTPSRVGTASEAWKGDGARRGGATGPAHCDLIGSGKMGLYKKIAEKPRTAT